MKIIVTWALAEGQTEVFMTSREGERTSHIGLSDYLIREPSKSNAD